MNKQIHMENKLRQLRLEAGLSQQDVAHRIGLASSDRISHWETGSSIPSVVNLFKLAATLGKVPHDLYPDLFDWCCEHNHCG